MEQEKLTVDLKDKIVVLTLTPFTDIDVDEVTKIQYHNLMGEMLTSSVLLNRVGNLLAEVEEIEREARMDLRLFEAQKVEQIQKGLVKIGDNPISSRGLSDTKMEHIIVRSPEWKIYRQKVIKAAKTKAIVSSLYWALKSKDDKLCKMSEKLRPEEFEKELVEDTINSIQIKISKKAIK